MADVVDEVQLRTVKIYLEDVNLTHSWIHF